MMAEKKVGDGLPANLAGMTKNQLYDIMSQMKTLIDQNQQQARQILIRNPLLTKALFQAQIMLGMVQPPQAIPKIEPPSSQQTQQASQPTPQSNIQPPFSSGRVGLQEQQPLATQTQQVSIRMQHQNQPAIPISSTPVPVTNIHSQPMSSSHSQRQGHLNPPVTSMPVPQSSQAQNIPPGPLHSTSQPPYFHQPEMPSSSAQLQQHPMHSGGITHLPPQQPIPPQPRPSSMPMYHNQYAPPKTGPNTGFQHHGGGPHPQHLSQHMFHSSARPPASSGPPFPQGQPHLPSQPPSQSPYQGGGAHFSGDFNNQVGTSWMSGLPEISTVTQLQGLPPSVPQSQIGPGGNQPPRPALLTPEMEKALLQQVMSLTPEQINLLPPEQRNQVLQLQQILRQ